MTPTNIIYAKLHESLFVPSINGRTGGQIGPTLNSTGPGAVEMVFAEGLLTVKAKGITLILPPTSVVAMVAAN